MILVRLYFGCYNCLMKKKLLQLRGNYIKRIVVSLILAHFSSLLLLIARTVDAGNPRYYFLVWNMLLAVLPLVLSVWLRNQLAKSSWLEWKNLLLTIFWLLFLPNSFYLITDLIHLHQTFEVNIYYDVVMFMSFIVNGFFTGYASLYLVHAELARRVRRRDAHLVIAAVLFVTSFAIFLGRFLRWNSWDVFLHPAGILFDASNQFIDPSSPSAFVTTVSFFILLSSTYGVVWNLAMYARPHAARDRR